MQSSDCLFHFTPDLENIFSIIEDGIWVKRSIEDFSFLVEVMPEIDIEAIYGNTSISATENINEEDLKISIPMACFCDIPIRQTESHSDIYGKYAVGFDKSWGIERGINPINYLVPESDLSTAIRKLNTLTSDFSPNTPNYDIRNAFFKFVSFLKLYEEFYEKSNYSNENHRFYNEREWRYVIKGDYEKIAPPEELDNPEEIRKKLNVSIEDLKYIVVKSNEEIPVVFEYFSKKGIDLDEYFTQLDPPVSH